MHVSWGISGTWSLPWRRKWSLGELMQSWLLAHISLCVCEQEFIHIPARLLSFPSVCPGSSMVPLLQLISRGSPMSFEDSNRIIPLFYLFSSLFSHSLISVHDSEFFGHEMEGTVVDLFSFFKSHLKKVIYLHFFFPSFYLTFPKVPFLCLRCYGEEIFLLLNKLVTSHCFGIFGHHVGLTGTQSHWGWWSCGHSHLYSPVSFIWWS